MLLEAAIKVIRKDNLLQRVNDAGDVMLKGLKLLQVSLLIEYTQPRKRKVSFKTWFKIKSQ